MVFYQENELLFYGGDLDVALMSQDSKVKEKVDAIPERQFIASQDNGIVEHIYNTLIVEPIVLHEDKKAMEQDEIKIDVSQYRDRNLFGERGPMYVDGIRIIVSVPYSGDYKLWKLKPNQWQSVFPRGIVRNPDSKGIGYLDIIIEQPSDEGPEKIKTLLDETLRDVKFYLESQKIQVDSFNDSLQGNILKAISNRREKLKTHDNLVKTLNIPLKRRKGAPEIRTISVRRKLVRPLPKIPKGGYKPEPGIAVDDYEHILSVIRHVGCTFESTPSTYAVHDEEELRDIILAHLNGHYQGGATGETFRLSGKTDIRIEDQDRAAFVAECKVWRGAKELTEAIDQLAGYLTWRDCKAAIVIFNKRNARFSELLEKVPETLENHPSIKKDLGQQAEGEWRYVFSSKEDELRDIHIHVFLFNLYVQKNQ